MIMQLQINMVTTVAVRKLSGETLLPVPVLLWLPMLLLSLLPSQRKEAIGNLLAIGRRWPFGEANISHKIVVQGFSPFSDFQLSKDEDLQEMEYHLTHPGSSGGSMSDVSETMDQGMLQSSCRTIISNSFALQLIMTWTGQSKNSHEPLSWKLIISLALEQLLLNLLIMVQSQAVIERVDDPTNYIPVKEYHLQFKYVKKLINFYAPTT